MLMRWARLTALCTMCLLKFYKEKVKSNLCVIKWVNISNIFRLNVCENFCENGLQRCGLNGKGKGERNVCEIVCTLAKSCKTQSFWSPSPYMGSSVNSSHAGWMLKESTQFNDETEDLHTHKAAHTRWMCLISETNNINSMQANEGKRKCDQSVDGGKEVKQIKLQERQAPVKLKGKAILWVLARCV